MKRKQLLTKTFLIAAMLFMGMNAWAETTTLLEYGTNDVPWTEKNISAFDFTYSDIFHETVYTHTYALDGDYAKITSNRCGYVQATATISPTHNATLNIEAEFLLNSGTGKYYTNGCASFFRFGNIWILENGQDRYSSCLLSGSFSSSNTGTSFHSDATNSSPYRGNGVTYRLVAEINTATNTLVSLNVYVGGSASASLSRTNVALTSPDYTTIEFGLFNSAHQTNNPVEGLKSIKITETPPAVTYADYTVHFVDNNGATVKADAVRNGEVGTTVNANSADQETFTSGDYKYTFKNDGGGVEVTNDGSAEFTVTYDKHEKYTYNVYAVNSNSVKLQDDPIATSTVFDDETASVKWSKYLKIGEQWYSTSETTFSTTATKAGSKNVVYSTSDVDYFFEFENLSRSGGYNIVTESANSYSNGLRGRISGASTLYTSAIAGGVYTLTMPWANSNGSGTPNKVFVHTRNDGANSDAIATLETSLGSTSTFTAVITVPDGHSVAFTGDQGTSNNQARIDYVTLTPYKVSVTIGETGWTSFASPYALDLSSLAASEGTATAYYASSVNDNSITMTSTEATVPAGEGLLLKGTAGATVTIPAVATDGTAIEGNKLVGCTSAFEITANTAGYEGFYVLASNEGKAEFQNIKNWVETNNQTVTIPAGKAYIDANRTGSARSLSIVFEEEAVTGIESVQDFKGSKVQGYYDLQGRRVSQPTKGMYIMDGKKVVVK